jgi:5-methylcytosine-specific restriction endonuclease McrA
MMRFVLAILATLLLTGCKTEKDRVFAGCREKSYSAPNGMERREMIAACMLRNGYQRQPCGSLGSLILNHRVERYLNASCFANTLDNVPSVEWMPL